MKTKLYLDTSIPSAYYDFSKPIRQLITKKWFENDSLLYDIYVSVITIEEIDEYKNIPKKEKIKQLLVDYDLKVLEFSEEAKHLAEEYMNKGAIPKSEPEDAYHIAIATLNDIQVLASWNFKHIVSVNPIRKVHEINSKHNLPLLEIGSLELIGGSKYGNV